MSPQALIYLIVVILLLVLFVYVAILLIETFIAPIDPRIKALVAIIVLLIIILWVMSHTGFLATRW